MPLFHAAALFISLMLVHYWDLPVALGIGDRPLSSDLVIDCLKNLDADAALLPPVLLEELSKDLETIKPLAKLSYVAFGGGETVFSYRRTID